MIYGAHVIIFSQDAQADRAFMRDVLGFSSIDVGGGWFVGWYVWRGLCAGYEVGG